MNLPIIEAVNCGGKIISIDKCIECQYYLGREFYGNIVICQKNNIMKN